MILNGFLVINRFDNLFEALSSIIGFVHSRRIDVLTVALEPRREFSAVVLATGFGFTPGHVTL
jgi:hypothetical protein